MRKIAIPCLAALTAFCLVRCGKANPFYHQDDLGNAVLGPGETRGGSSSTGAIYQVTKFVTGVGGAKIVDPSGTQWLDTELPFKPSAPELCIPRDFGQTVLNQHVPFSFTYSYPSNNFKIAQAYIRIDTSRDNSDTEGIFVDGVLTGRPPTNLVQTTSPKLTYPYYVGNTPANPASTYYMDFSLAHYLQNTRQTFELDIAQLLPAGTRTLLQVLQDGFLPCATGDDSPIYQAYLFIHGYTISRNALTCNKVNGLTFENVYLHNDGNTVGQAAFNGTVETPYQSTTSAVSGFKSIETYFDAKLPSVDESDLSISVGTLDATLARDATPAAIVVNGIGISSTGFDRTTATSQVESWVDSSTAAWETFLSTIPTNGTPTAVSLNLASLLGTTKLRTLLLQGKLNVSFAGGFRSVAASEPTSARVLSHPVSGPTLPLKGTYSVQNCEVPDDASSPLTDGAVAPPDPSDTTGPQVISLQASQITSSSALIQWLTDEGADTQVGYGVGNTNTLSAQDTTLSAYHEVRLTGLSPYKYYFYQARTADGNGNLTTSAIKVFRTLR